MTPLHRLWKTATGLPVIGDSAGKWVATTMLVRKAPYFGSVKPRIVEMREDYAEVTVPDRKKNHNHIGTVHAIALCNGLEMAMGALAEASIPSDKRWIPKGMEVSYTAKATGDITCTAETDRGQWTGDDPDLPVRVRGVREDGTVVIEGVIKLWVTPKKA